MGDLGPPQHGIIPPPTVREAMGFGGFRSAVLVAGAKGLERRIEWVRIMETPDTVRHVRPGDLLCTTAFPIKDDRQAQIALVSRLADAGGAGLIIKPERYLRELPAEMAEEADRVSMPLFTLTSAVPWADLMAPLLERIINAEHWRLKRSLEIHHRFTELVLDGKGVDEICGTLADLLESAVSVEDASFHLLAHSGGSGDPHRKETIAHHGTPPRVLFDPKVQAILREAERRRGPIKVPPLPHVGMSRERIIAPIFTSNQALGFISVIGAPPEYEELAFMAVEQAALVLALALSKEREVAEVEARVRGEFLEDLIQGSFGEDSAAARRARHLGYPMAGLHVLVITDIDDFRGFNLERQITEDSIQAVKRDYFRRVAGTVRAVYPRSLLAARSDSVYALVPAEPVNGRARLQALGRQIQEAIRTWSPGFTVSVGYSGPVEAPAGVAGAHREVRAVLENLARFSRKEQVLAVADVGLTGLLAGIADDRLSEFAERHLGSLVEHDKAKGGALLPTLRAFLEQGEQQAAARHLSIHPNTLRYRLDRIREISGLELEDPETRLNLAVALRVQSLVGL